MSRLFILTLINALIVVLSHVAFAASSDGVSELAAAVDNGPPIRAQDMLSLFGFSLSLHYLYKVFFKKPFSFKPVFFVVLFIINFMMLWLVARLFPAVPNYVGFIFSVVIVSIPASLAFRFFFKESYKIFVLELLLALIIWPLLIGFALLNFELGWPSTLYGFLGAVFVMSLFAIRNKRQDKTFPIKKLAQVQIVIVLCFLVLPMGMNIYKQEMEKIERARVLSQPIQFIDVNE